MWSGAYWASAYWSGAYWSDAVTIGAPPPPSGDGGGIGLGFWDVTEELRKIEMLQLEDEEAMILFSRL